MPGPLSAARGFPRAFLLVTAGLLLANAALAQQGATVSGRALDGGDGTPIGLATVVIVAAESGDTLSGALAGQDGRFLLRGLSSGRYIIRVTVLGFQPAARDVLVSELNQSYDLGDIRLDRLVRLEDPEGHPLVVLDFLGC